MENSFKCVFCKKSLPVKLDKEFEAHMKFHNAEFNLEFIFVSMLLQPAGMERTIEFMLSQPPAGSSKDEEEKKASYTRLFTRNRDVVKEGIETQENKVEDNIIDDESYEKSAMINYNGGENKDANSKARNEQSLEKLIQDDNLNNENLLEESSFPAGSVQTTEVTEKPKRKRGRPRKVTLETENKTEQLKIAPRGPRPKRGRKKKENCSCNITFKNDSSRRKHLEKYHSPYPCDKCSLTFKTEEHLLLHKEDPKDRHDPDYMATTCFTCGAQFRAYRFLKDHKKSVHEIGEKKKCELCPQFVTNIKKHLRKCHTEVKVCDICNKPVKSLENHKLTMHGSEEDKKYKCDLCGKGFILRDKLVAHKVIHSKEKPFKCKFHCGYASKTAGNLRKHHEGVHRNELHIEKHFAKEDCAVNPAPQIEIVDQAAQEEKFPCVMEKNAKCNPETDMKDEMEDEEDIDLNDLEEVTFNDMLPVRGPVIREVSERQEAPSVIQVTLPLSQIIVSSPVVSEQEYQEVCSFFT